jgi:hypothetical protein
MKTKHLPKEGSRVKVLSLDIKGTITYIDTPSLFVDHFYPIQVELDEPWDKDSSSVQRVYRTNLKDLRKLRKKVK